MRKLGIAAIACLCATQIGCGPSDGRKSIVVDRSKFGEKYPAVWLDPATGELGQTTNDREPKAPAENFQIWIEPSDPEIAFFPKENPSTKDCGFILLGSDAALFDNPVVPADPKWVQKVPKDWVTPTGGSVVYCKGSGVDCVVRITASDPKGEVLKFDWRPLPKK